MALDDEARRKAAEFINATWKTKACHLCGFNTWEIDGFVLLPAGNQPLRLVFGQQTLSCVVVTCKKCGNTHLINAFVAGLGSP